MGKSKLINILLLCICWASVIFAVVGSIDSFNSQTNPFNITHISYINYTYNISIPYYAYVKSFSLTIDTISQDYVDPCYQEFANVSTSCGGLSNGNYVVYDMPTSEDMIDGDFSTQSNRVTEWWIDVNYTIPENVYNATWRIKDATAAVVLNERNLSIPLSCVNKTTRKLILKVDRQTGAYGTIPISYYCLNSSNYLHTIYNSTGADLFYEEAIYWNITAKYNIEVGELDGDYEWSSFNASMQNVSLDISIVNGILENNCNCTNCIINNSNCEIPITFNSNVNGTYQINLTNLTYTTGDLDNCSNSFGIPDNATALTIHYVDTNNLSLIVNSSLSLTYDSNTFYNSMNTHMNDTFCIYPSWAEFTGDLTLQYSYLGTTYNYYLSDITLNNNTQNIYLYIANGTTQVTAKVYDNYNKNVEGAYIHVQQYDWGSGNYLPIGIFATNFEGQVEIPLVLDTEYYRFFIYYPSDTLRFTSSSTYIYDTSISFQIDIVDGIGDEFFDAQNVYSSLTFIEATDYFSYAFSGTVDQACMKVWGVSLLGNTLLNNSCVTGTSGTILLPVTNTSGNSYLAKSFTYIGEVETFMDSLTKSYPAEEDDSKLFLWATFVMTIVFAFIILFSIPLGILMIPIPTVLMSAIGAIPLDISVAIGLEIAALVLAILLNNRG